MLSFMNFTLFTNFIGLLLISLSMTVNSMPIGLQMRDVFVPPITSPTVNNTWPVGSIQTVTWDTSDAPEQITNPIGRILLRHNDLSDTNHPIAEGFDILTGAVNVTVPDVEPGDYQIVLFGDSGNFSPTFSIVSADTGNY
ncbi:hypothetical protein VKT23_011902 [Stygiomarasmius scandens]|uniref:Yeast cell wall synthesis Kre9/Knh1-like N-terminal domain-containing protein n=1 Tax=Marasmiellus scandens TaxID=2682957 RepID=A0ABR1J837_9AGAR